MKHTIFLVLVTLFISGCNQAENKSVKIFGDTYHKVPTGYSTTTAPAVRKSKEEREEEREKAIALAQLKSNENLKIAEIEAKRQVDAKKIEVQAELNTKQIEAESVKQKVLVEKEVSLESQKVKKEIAFLKEKTLLETKDKDIYINQLIIAATIVIVILALIVYYIIQHKKRLLQNKLEEDKIRHEEYMQESAQQHEKISRVLSIIADGDTDEYVKKELLSILKEQPEEQALIAHTQKENEELRSVDNKMSDTKIEVCTIDIEDESETKIKE